jgi:hypothetical protein
MAKVLQPYLRIGPEVRGAQLGAWEPKKRSFGMHGIQHLGKLLHLEFEFRFMWMVDVQHVEVLSQR